MFLCKCARPHSMCTMTPWLTCTHGIKGKGWLWVTVLFYHSPPYFLRQSHTKLTVLARETWQWVPEIHLFLWLTKCRIRDMHCSAQLGSSWFHGKHLSTKRAPHPFAFLFSFLHFFWGGVADEQNEDTNILSFPNIFKQFKVPIKKNGIKGLPWRRLS